MNARICIAGDWHQATVTGACLAAIGHEVRGVVSSQAIADRYNDGRPPVHEPELPQLMRSCLESGQLRYMGSYEDGLRDAEFAIIALDTPVADDDTAQLGPVLETARSIGRALDGDVVLIVTAQVPVGTCELLQQVVAGESGRRVGVAHVPEFLRLGQAVRTFMKADRFIIGCDDDHVAAAVTALYAPLNRPMLRMSVQSAEMTKHACNAFLATSISFANEVADLCARTGADIDDVTRGMRLDHRIGKYAFLSPGLGFAGGTLGRDLRALQALGKAHSVDTAIADAVLDVNAARPGLVCRRLEAVYGDIRDLQVGVLGLTYKPGTSTMRRSVALEIVRELVGRGASVAAYDPLADLSDVEDLPPLLRTVDPYTAAEDADALVLVTPWDGLVHVDTGILRTRMSRPLFLDMCNHFDADTMRAHGFTYMGIGRGAGVAVLEELQA
jgi:UDPglucose 6-dehydrogenase